MRVVATRSAVGGWLSLVGFCALFLALAWHGVAMTTQHGWAWLLSQSSRGFPNWLIYLVLFGGLAFILPRLLRATNTLIDHGSAVIWLQDDCLYSSTHRPIPVAEIASIKGEASFGMRVVRVTSHAGRNYELGVGGMEPDADDAAHELRGLLGLIPPLS
ncbi:MAG TPA: hypothetical protein VGR32_10965 [Brevundimonas sp.]|jgi:hypothetical protein|uniref:hypothetical protein n=1 Tax=Brevundimonas sp. TaxID=1871086 RepID=UPI002DF1E024|nr:hypothetical protein [Brevundimonas sp.]